MLDYGKAVRRGIRMRRGDSFTGAGRSPAPAKLLVAVTPPPHPTPPPPGPPPAPLDKRLLFVTGKGGVGKSTVAAALGMVAARHGRRTIVAELARRDDVSRALEGESAPVFAETELAPDLFTISIDPELAMEEYLTDQLSVRALAERLSSSRIFTYLAAATPGLRELLAMGKVWELAQSERRTPGASPYDLVVVDAPATGHGIAFLTAPRTFAAAAAVGPIARQARTIHDMLVDPRRTGVLAVAAPTEAAVAETLVLRDTLRAELDLELDRVVVNAMEPRRFGGADAAALLRAQEQLGDQAPEVERAALRAARSGYARSLAQQAQLARLRRALDRAPVSLPLIFASVLGAQEIGLLASALEGRL
jgi:anion-transporting  ArsA/GET3 family ATPase